MNITTELCYDQNRKRKEIIIHINTDGSDETLEWYTVIELILIEHMNFI